MLYPFREILKDGSLGEEVHGFEFPLEKYPPMGKKIRRKGKRYQRVIHLADYQIHVEKTGDSPFVSRQLPKNYVPHKQAGGQFDERGNCVFESKRQLERTQAKARDFSEHDQLRHPGLEKFGVRT